MYWRITVDSWNEAVLLSNEISHKEPLWAFRGQSDSDWPLVTKFEREARKYKCDPYWFKNREKVILKDFQRKAHQYIQNLPALEKYIDWLAFIQHFGGSTRLLDFTYSYYVATYFATESSDRDSAIWAVNINGLLQAQQSTTGIDVLNSGGYDKIIEKHIELANNNIKDRTNEDSVYVLEPFYQHERIAIQQGLFLFPANIDEPFPHNICSAFQMIFKELSDTNAKEIEANEINKLESKDMCILKIVLPYSIHCEALAHLQQMNISAATLFPGLDGFARSLNYHFRHLEYLKGSCGT